MIRVAIECESLEGASWGIGRMTRKLAEELSRRPELADRFRFTLYFNGPAPDMPWLNHELFRTKSVGLPTLLGKWAPLSFSIYYYLLLPIRLWLDRPDMTYWPNYMLPLIAPPGTLVMLTEDVWHEMRNHRRPLRYKAGYWVFANWAALFATRIMAISHASADALVRLFGIAPERIAVNELAVDAPQTAEPMPGKYLLYVGQAFERRHLRESLLAYENIAPDYPELRFIAIGPDKYDPPAIDALIAEINERLGRPAIQRIERATDEELARFYKGATAFVYVSDMEAFALPPLEALSYGTRPIVNDLPVHHEILGNNAEYVGDTEPEAIANGMRRALDYATEVSAEEATTKYTWKAHADRFLEIAEQMAGK